MLKLVLSDVRRHAAVWTWTCVVAVVAGACVTGQLLVFRGALSSARGAGDQEMIESATIGAVFIIVSVALATVAVLTSVASLTIEQREHSHGLWRSLGMGPGTLRAVLVTQLGIVGAVGSAGGALLAYPVARAMIPLLVDQNMVLPGTTPRWVPLDITIAAAVIAGSVFLGGWSAMRRAARAEIADLLSGRGNAAGREARGGQRLRGSHLASAGRPSGKLRRGSGQRGTRARRGGMRLHGGLPGIPFLRGVTPILLRLAAVAGCGVGIVAAFRTIGTGGVMSEDAVNAAILGSFACLTLACLLVRWLVPLLLRLAAAVPMPGASWQVAARTAALESRRSSATVTPFLVAIGLVAVMFGARAAGLGNVRLSGFVSMFGLAFLTAWTGGVAVIAMSAGRRRRDAALLRAAGARDGEVLAAQVTEGVLHAACAIGLGVAVSAGASALLAAATGNELGAVLLNGPWVELAVVGGLTVATVCTAVVVSSRAGRHQSVGQVLRAKE